jgi:hypothetical protein
VIGGDSKASIPSSSSTLPELSFWVVKEDEILRISRGRKGPKAWDGWRYGHVVNADTRHAAHAVRSY